jgi:hypothetical protein
MSDAAPAHDTALVVTPITTSIMCGSMSHASHRASAYLHAGNRIGRQLYVECAVTEPGGAKQGLLLH